MAESAAVPLVCQLDFIRRSSVFVRQRNVFVAEHLVIHPSLPLAEPLLADIRDGRPLERHLSPMKNQRATFKRAHKKGTWIHYRRMMDHLFNKWGFRHFHCGEGSWLVFVHICDVEGVARVIDLVPHNGDWLIEKRLVEIVVRNWAAANITRSFGEGPSSMTEADLFAARKQGLNMTVNVDGTYYLPARGGLMSDGSAYVEGLLAPIAICGRRYEASKKPEVWLDSPHSLVLGLDPDDPRPAWLMAAEQAGFLASRRRKA